MNSSWMQGEHPQCLWGRGRRKQAASATALASVQESLPNIPSSPATRGGWWSPSHWLHLSCHMKLPVMCLWSPACAKAEVKAGKRSELLTGMPTRRACLLRLCLSITEISARFRLPLLSSTGVSSGNSATVFCRVVQIVLYLLNCQVQCHKQ